MLQPRRYWAVVPAAGVGRRMGASIPKQYLKLGERTVIERTLAVLTEHPTIVEVVVAIAPDDQWWPEIAPAGIRTCTGGAERCHSVLNALHALLEHGAEPDDWCLVHDAVRPLLKAVDIDRLVSGVGDYADGFGTVNLLGFEQGGGATIGGPLTEEFFFFDPEMPSYDILNLRFGISSEKWDAALFINNVTDETAFLALDQERGSRARVGYLTNQPRTLGLTYRVNF